MSIRKCWLLTLQLPLLHLFSWEKWWEPFGCLSSIFWKGTRVFILGPGREKRLHIRRSAVSSDCPSTEQRPLQGGHLLPSLAMALPPRHPVDTLCSSPSLPSASSHQLGPLSEWPGQAPRNSVDSYWWGTLSPLLLLYPPSLSSLSLVPQGSLDSTSFSYPCFHSSFH